MNYRSRRIVMKSFISDAFTRAGPAAAPEMAPSFQGYSQEDEELERILSSLKTNIKIVGCGGGGSNTIDRMTEVGIAGAELYAANTDAQHLLAIRAPHKILLGRRSTRGLGLGRFHRSGRKPLAKQRRRSRRPSTERTSFSSPRDWAEALAPARPRSSRRSPRTLAR